MWPDEEQFVCALRESIEFDYFNVIFISSENSIVAKLKSLSGWGVLESYQLSPPSDSVIARYYEENGVKEGEFLAKTIGLNFRFLSAIVKSQSTSTEELRSKHIICIQIEWLNSQRIALKGLMENALGSASFRELQKIAITNGTPSNWSLGPELATALIRNNVIVKTGIYKQLKSRLVTLASYEYYSRFIVHVLLETQF